MISIENLPRFYFAIFILVLALAILPGCQNQNQLSSPYLVLYAFDAEGELLSQEMTIKDSLIVLGRTVYVGRLSHKEIVLAESGVGMTNAAMTTQAMIDQFHPKAIIFSGIAGAIDSSVQIGDIVVCDRWRTHDYGYYGQDGFQVSGIKIFSAQADSLTRAMNFEVDNSLLQKAQQLIGSDIALGNIGERIPALSVGGVGVSGNCFIDSREKRLWLNEEFDALVTDMESAAVGQVSAVNGIPFIVFRSASDLAGGSGSETADNELEQFFTIAADNSSKVVIRFLSDL